MSDHPHKAFDPTCPDCARDLWENHRIVLDNVVRMTAALAEAQARAKTAEDGEILALRNSESLRASLAEVTAERDEARREAVELRDEDPDAGLWRKMQQAEIDALRKGANEFMKQALGVETYSRLWGPPLEAMGRGVDRLMRDKELAETERDAALQSEGAMREALDAARQEVKGLIAALNGAGWQPKAIEFFRQLEDICRGASVGNDTMADTVGLCCWAITLITKNAAAPPPRPVDWAAAAERARARSALSAPATGTPENKENDR